MSKKDRVVQRGDSEKFLGGTLGFLVVAALFITPLLVFQNRLFPFTTSKSFWFMGVAELVFFLWVYMAVRFEKYRLNRTQWIVFAVPLALIAWLTISGIFAHSPNLAFWSSFERGTGLIFFYHLLAFLVVIISLVKSRGQKFVDNIYGAVFLSGIVIALTTWIGGTSLIGTTGHGGLLGNSSYAGAYLLFSIFSGMLLWIRTNAKIAKFFVGLGILVIILCPVFVNLDTFDIGDAQAAAGALAIGIGLAVLIRMTTSGKAWVKYTGSSVIGVIIIGAIIAGVLFLQPSSSVHQAYVNYKSEARFMFWQSAVDGIKERPMVGWGPENYSVAYHKYFNPDIFSSRNTSEGWVDKPHNAPLEMFVAGGIPGGILYLTFLVLFITFPIILYRRKLINAWDMSLWIGLSAAVAIQNLVFFDTVVAYIATFALFGIMAGKFEVAEEGESFADLGNYKTVAAGATIIGMVACWIFFVHQPVKKSLQMSRLHHDPSAIRSSGFPNGSLMGDGADFGFIMDKIFVNYQDGIDQMKQDPAKLDQVHKTIQKLLDTTDGLSATAETDYRLWISAARLTLFDMTVTRTVDQVALERAQRYLERAKDLSDTDPQVYWLYGQWSVYAQKLPDAEQYFQQALDLNPEILQSHQYMALFEKQFGTPAGAAEVIREAKERFPNETF